MASDQESRTGRAWTPRRVAFCYLVLFVFSIPWYWPSGYGERLIAGFPVWSLASLACYVAAAVLTVLTIDDVWQAESNRSDIDANERN